MQEKILGHTHIALFIISFLVMINLFCTNASGNDIVTIGRETQPEIEIDLHFLQKLPPIYLAPYSLIRGDIKGLEQSSKESLATKITSKRKNKVGKYNKPKPTFINTTGQQSAFTGANRLPKKPKFGLSEIPRKQELNTVSRIKAPKKPNLNNNKLVTSTIITKKPKSVTNRNNVIAALPIKKQKPQALKVSDNKVYLQLLFKPTKTRLTGAEVGKLNKFSKKMVNDKSKYIQLLAYASSASTNASNSRRLSLLRALEVRNLLIKKGVPSNRMSVRALGDRFESGAPNRVDVIIKTR